MPLDVLGCTRATLMEQRVLPVPEGMGNLVKLHRAGDRPLQLLVLNEEFPSKRKSSTHADYVPALCTHRPSLLPIEWFGEAFWSWGPEKLGKLVKLVKLGHLGSKVVTRFP